MVSIGTVFSLAIAGAIGIGAFVVYRNRNEIGSAFSRGIESSISAPIGNYFTNLFNSVTPRASSPIPNMANTGIPNDGATREELEAARQNGIDTAQADYQERYGQQIRNYEDTLEVYRQQIQDMKIETDDNGIVTMIPDDFPGEEQRDSNPEAPLNEPLFAPSPAGYYYRDFAPGGRMDQQVNLQEGTADSLRQRGQDLYFLAPTMIQEAGFRVFGQSKGFQ